MRVALVDGDTIRQRVIRPCPAKEAEQVVTNQLLDQIREVMNPEVTAIGVGVPSVVDAEKGIVYNVANIPAWQEVHLKEILEKEFGIPARINNDSNCFTLGVSAYVPGLRYSREKRDAFPDVVAAARRADVVLVFLGEEAILSGEAHSLADLNLKGSQSELLAALKATGPLSSVSVTHSQLWSENTK